MLNQFLKNLNKIEFVVTYACTGRCKHCSEGEHTSSGERIDPGSAVDDNPYNRKTREILDSFADMEIPEGEGNVIFPEGNALKYLAEYFTSTLPENPYVEDPHDVRCVSFEPNGDVLGGNVYRNDIMGIIKDYVP